MTTTWREVRAARPPNEDRVKHLREHYDNTEDGMGDEDERTTTAEKVRATVWCERWARKVRKQRPDLTVSTRLKGPHWRYTLTIVRDVDGERRTISVTSEPPFIRKMAEAMLRRVDGATLDLGEPGAWVKDDVTGEWRDALPGETPTMKVTNGEEQA